jgi:hypothetical protein
MLVNEIYLFISMFIEVDIFRLIYGGF